VRYIPASLLCRSCSNGQIANSPRKQLARRISLMLECLLAKNAPHAHDGPGNTHNEYRPAIRDRLPECHYNPMAANSSLLSEQAKGRAPTTSQLTSSPHSWQRSLSWMTRLRNSHLFRPTARHAPTSSSQQERHLLGPQGVCESRLQACSDVKARFAISRRFARAGAAVTVADSFRVPAQHCRARGRGGSGPLRR